MLAGGASPRLKGYRNKCEFTIGKGADGKPCVGYQLGKGKLGQTMVGAPTDCTNVPPEMLAAVAVIQEWLLRDGQLATFDKWGKGGVWRQIVARLAFASTVAADGAAAADGAVAADGTPPTLLLGRRGGAEGEGEENAAERGGARAGRGARSGARRGRSIHRRRCRSALRGGAHTRAVSTSRRRTRCHRPIFGPPHLSSRCAGCASACRPPPSSR